MQRPVGNQSVTMSSCLTEDEVIYMKEMAAKRFDMITRALREMPRTMLLTLR